MINNWDTMQPNNPHKQRLLKIMKEIMEGPIDEQINRGKSLCQKYHSVYDDVYYLIDETNARHFVLICQTPVGL